MACEHSSGRHVSPCQEPCEHSSSSLRPPLGRAPHTTPNPWGLGPTPGSHASVHAARCLGLTASRTDVFTWRRTT